jgi:hypothetical protein
MAIQKIDSIYLYTDMTWAANETCPSVEARNHMDSLGLPYTLMNYADPEQHEAALGPLRDWQMIGMPDALEAFPFVVYTEVHDDIETDRQPKVIIYGIDAIKQSNIASLYKLGR